MKAKYGSPSQTDVFRLKVNAAGNGYDINQIDNVTAAALNTDKVFAITETKNTKVDLQEGGEANVPFGNYEDTPELDAVLEALARPASSGAPKPGDYYLEDGTKRTAGSDLSTLALIVVYGPLNEAGDKRKLWLIAGNFNPKSGSLNQQTDEWSQPVIQFDGALLNYALPVPLALGDGALIDGTVTGIDPIGTIAADTGWTRVWAPVV